jgi:hypothetical protein
MFISILYMFRAATYPSSGELIVSIRHLVYVTLCRRPFSVQGWMRLQFILCYRKFSFPVILSVLDIHQFKSHTTRVAGIGHNLPIPPP